MLIEKRIQESIEFKKLEESLHNPIKANKGKFCTVTNTTLDIQEILLKLIVKTTNKGIISSNLINQNIRKYLINKKHILNITFQKLIKILDKNSYIRVDKIIKKGEFSLHGDIISLWPSFYEHPIRAIFFGEELEKIEIYDELYMKKIRKLKLFTISNESYLESDIERQSINIKSSHLYINKNIIIFEKNISKSSIDFKFSYAPMYFKRLDLFKKDFIYKLNNKWQLFISTKHTKELPILYKRYFIGKRYKSGFENHVLKIALYTDRELFGTIFISSERIKNSKQINRYLAQIEGEVKIDEYIVHENYGIAIYKGIEQKYVLNHYLDYLILKYDQGDILSVPISQVHKLTKYIGPSNIRPKITRLGRTNWERIKNKVKKSIFLLAKELLSHYAKVEMTKAKPLLPHEWEDKLASEFEFDETPDQKRTIYEILLDLQRNKPMNRLLVGDVGFGKTEVAIRAAFRTVLNGYQVALLCPTTILVSQHFSVFKHRMKNYPVVIKTLSRFSSKNANKDNALNLTNGNIDIIIGTHRLLSNDIKFKKLKLLIIDEEQRFGVAQKEKIKRLSYSSHTLYMSATPIPRTLSMALSSLKDISIITTPPPGRKSIKTHVESFSWNKVINSILFEIKRGGQIYFVHNKVLTINSIKEKLLKMLPHVIFAVAHGQMHPSTLQKIMWEFYTKKIDCLICTTIIENGIDIKNVNTIIINQAQNFGLSELYQLRGRVGRSSKQAYCYLFYTYKDLYKNKELLHEIKHKYIPFQKAKERLKAISESQELGSGFKIATKDLEIRGTGNLLGKEQHGNIYAIGFGLYTQMLANEIDRLKKLKGSLN